MLKQQGKALSAPYIPVERGFGSLTSQHGDIPAQRQKAISPMDRWMSEQPGESPYHNVGFVASSKDPRMQTAESQSKQHTQASSNPATYGSWELMAKQWTKGGKTKA